MKKRGEQYTQRLLSIVVVVASFRFRKTGRPSSGRWGCLTKGKSVARQLETSEGLRSALPICAKRPLALTNNTLAVDITIYRYCLEQKYRRNRV